MGLIIGTRTKKGYKPSLLHRLLKPRIKGNTINGLGESTLRRPNPVYHFRETPGVKLPFKWVQQLFYSRMSHSPAFHHRIEERRNNILKPLNPVATVKRVDTADNWTHRVKAFGLANEADFMGVARMRPEWVYEGFEIKEPWIIIQGVRQDFEKIKTAPAHTTNEEVLDQYNRSHRANYALASWIRSQGYYAERYKGFMGTPLTMIPAAIEAGFGQLGKHGSLMHRQFGPNFRLGYVLTDMPLVEDRQDDLPVDDFCLSCQVCSKACPTNAISDSKQLVRGVEKWYVDFDKCVPFFNDTFGCNVCVAVCPFTRPGAAEPLFSKLEKRRERKAQETV
jgi:epoxyqueuosine reductase